MVFFEKDISSIRKIFNDKFLDVSDKRYLKSRPSVFLFDLEKRDALLKILSKNFGFKFIEKKFLEVGCGTGDNLITLMGLSVPPEHISGVELSFSINEAERRLPSCVDLRVGNFCELCLAEKFDVIMFYTVLSSVLNRDFRFELLRHAYSHLNENGILVVYDFVYDNPRNKNVRRVSLKELGGFFPERKWFFSSYYFVPMVSKEFGSFSVCNKVFEQNETLVYSPNCVFKEVVKKIYGCTVF